VQIGGSSGWKTTNPSKKKKDTELTVPTQRSVSSKGRRVKFLFGIRISTSEKRKTDTKLFNEWSQKEGKDHGTGGDWKGGTAALEALAEKREEISPKGKRGGGCCLWNVLSPRMAQGGDVSVGCQKKGPSSRGGG